MTADFLHRRDVRSLARRQHWVLSRPQILAFGISRGALRHLVRTRQLSRIHPGVYAVQREPRDLDDRGRWMAAVLACGDDALLAGFAAARLWDLLDRVGAVPEVVVPAARNPAPTGVTVHRSATLRPGDAVVRDGIPVTSVPRTLLDVAMVATEPQVLKRAVRQAERLHRLDIPVLCDRTSGPRNSPAAKRLHALLRLYVPVGGTQSELEAEFVELLVRNRLPRPEEQRWIGRARADFVYRELRLVVEVDGRDPHDTSVAFLEDRRRDRRLKALGYDVLHFTWAEVVHEPRVVARELRAAFLRRRMELGLEASRHP